MAKKKDLPPGLMSEHLKHGPLFEGFHCLFIDNWIPARLNELLRVHWAVRRKRKQFDADLIKAEAIRQEVPKAVGKRRVSLVITLAKGMKRGDEDNWFKSLLDGLVHAKLLCNDSFDWCERGGITFLRGPEKRTVIVLEDVNQ